jgi:hypothetical protein
MEQIRPLVAFKKHRAALVKFILRDCTSHCKKSEDNEIYACMAYIQTIKYTQLDGINNFYFNSKGNHNNKGLKVLIGQIVLLGWYYEVEDFADNIGANIIKLHSKKNDWHCKAAAKHIKNNFVGYYHNPSELNEWYKILKEFKE